MESSARPARPYLLSHRHVLLLGLFALVGALGAGTPTSDASTVVSASSGAVSVMPRDNAPHKLRVWASVTDVGDRSFPVSDPVEQFPGAVAASASWQQAASNMSRAYVGDLAATFDEGVEEVQDASDALNAAIADYESPPSLARSAMSDDERVLQELASIARDILATSQEARDAIANFNSAAYENDKARERMLELIAKVGDVSTEELSAAADAIVDAGINEASASARVTASMDKMDLINVALKDAARRAEHVLESNSVLRAAFQGTREAWATLAKEFERMLRLAAHSTAIKHSILLAIGVGFGALAYGFLGTSHAAELNEIDSERRLIIQDLGESELIPDGDCQKAVRTVTASGSERTLKNAVKCPLPDQPGWFLNAVSLMFDGTLSIFGGLYVEGGDGPDSISVRIPAGVDISNIVVGGAGGDDVIRTPTQHSAWVIGGQGRDLIQTGHRDDTVSGDALYAGGSQENSDSYSDTIVTRGGDDQIDAGQGNNLVLAGAGVDDILAGDGANVLVGGNDADFIRNGHGPVLVVGAELDGPNAIDSLVDCGPGTQKYALLSAGLDAEGEPEVGHHCADGAPASSPTLTQLASYAKSPPPLGGTWPWIG